MNENELRNLIHKMCMASPKAAMLPWEKFTLQMAGMTVNQAADNLHDEYSEMYAFVWRNSIFHFSSQFESYELNLSTKD